MKKLLVIILVVAGSFTTWAQQSQVLFEQLTEEYSEQDGFSASMLSSDLFDLYLKKKDLDESSELYDALKALDNILVVSQSKISLSREEAFFAGKSTTSDAKEDLENIYNEVVDHYKGTDYILFKTENRMGEDVKVYLQKENEDIVSLAVLSNSSSSTSLVELNGKIDLSNVASLSQALNLRGLENLYKIDNNATYPRYPGLRSHSMSEEQIAEMTLRAKEMAEQARLSDKQIAEIEKQAQIQAQRQMEMAEKYREMAEKYGRQPVFLSTPGDTNTVYFIDGKKIKSSKVKEQLKKIEIERLEKTSEDGKTIIKITSK